MRLAKIGWDPLSVDQGFKAGDNVITVSSCLSTDSVYALSSSIEGTDKVEVILGKLAARIVDIQLECFLSRLVAPRHKTTVCINSDNRGSNCQRWLYEGWVQAVSVRACEIPGKPV